MNDDRREGVAETITVRRRLVDELPDALPPAPARFLLTDENVARLLVRGWHDRPGYRWSELPQHVVPAGEASKTWETLGAVLRAMDAAGLDRDGQLVAVGGGVVTDLGGFAASLHRRGVDWVAVPTTLVGQVDAALGGKTAVDLGGGKNTVGTFHHPAAVLVDPTCLATLDRRELAAGMAEVLKTALLDGPDAWDAACALDEEAVRTGSDATVAVIRRCLATKGVLVERDPFDRGERRLLNLGHTFGHALEALALAAAPRAGAAASGLLHGEAVGLGLLCAARLGAGRADGPLEEVLRAQLRTWGLPETRAVEADAVLAEMGRDKKRRAGGHVLVVVAAPGEVGVRRDVPEEEIRAALEAIRPR